MQGDETVTPGPTIVEFDWGNTGVEEMARQDNVSLADKAAVQVRITGMLEAAGGTEIAIAVGAGVRYGHPSDNFSSWSWNTPSINSEDYTGGWCGSWQSIQTSGGLICRAPGDPGLQQRTTFYYRQLEQFDVTSSGVEFDFYVTAYDATKQEISCNRVAGTEDIGVAPTWSYPMCR